MCERERELGFGGNSNGLGVNTTAHDLHVVLNNPVFRHPQVLVVFVTPAHLDAVVLKNTVALSLVSLGCHNRSTEMSIETLKQPTAPHRL